MSSIRCESCDELRSNAPEFVQNGVTDNVCASLQNNTGLNPSLSTLHENAEDLHNVNDCTIGRMTQEIDAYEVCDWKDFMKKLLPNIYEFNKAMICADKGVRDTLDKHNCMLGLISEGRMFYITAQGTNPDAYFVAGAGVDITSRAGEAAAVHLRYVGGALGMGDGALLIQGAQNAYWERLGNMDDGGELLYEIRIRKDAFGIKRIYGGVGQQGNQGGFQASVFVFDPGTEAWGQHGLSDTTHTVPDGWTYIQIRMTYVMKLLSSAGRAEVSPRYYVGMVFDENSVC